MNEAEQLRTVVQADRPAVPVDLGEQILSLGSCFAENISKRLFERGFRIASNPFGVLYNPGSVGRALERLCDGVPFQREDLFQHRGCWHSFDHHGSFSGADREQVLARINEALRQGHEAMARCDVLLITFGTAFAWFHGDRPGVPVANCHRLPAAAFQRRLLESGEIVEAWSGLIEDLQRARSRLRVVLTVSPVRHLGHAPTQNSLSKAHLTVAAHELAARLDCVHLFPAYEIVMDELRDYRFYARDMAHPSELAQDIVWNRFAGACLSSGAVEFCARVEGVLTASRHRPLEADSASTKAFAASQLRRVQALQAEYPEADLSVLERHFETLAGDGGAEAAL